MFGIWLLEFAKIFKIIHFFKYWNIMTKKNTYYFIYNELQIVLGNLKMDTNHFFSDGYTHLSAQRFTNTTVEEKKSYVP